MHRLVGEEEVTIYLLNTLKIGSAGWVSWLTLDTLREAEVSCSQQKPSPQAVNYSAIFLVCSNISTSESSLWGWKGYLVKARGGKSLGSEVRVQG